MESRTRCGFETKVGDLCRHPVNSGSTRCPAGHPVKSPLGARGQLPPPTVLLPGTMDLGDMFAGAAYDPLAGEELKTRTAMFDERVARQEEQHPGYQRWWNGFTPLMTEKLGVLVVPPSFPEEHARELQERGTFTTSIGVPIEGRSSQCHANAAQLWLDKRVCAIATGYAMSDDGLWRQHSWGLDEGGRVVETTEERIAYFGFEMNEDESRDFVDLNL